MVTSNFQLPVSELRPVRIRDLEQSALCFSYDEHGLDILVDHFEGNAKAILLNGEHAFHSYAIEAAYNWKGLAVGNYQLVVDISSALDTENTGVPLGALSLSSNGVLLQVATTNSYGFTEKSGLKLNTQSPVVAPGLQTSFTRWAFQFGDKEQPQTFWIDAIVDEKAS
jgi:hypothetical protein